jgi:tRNA(Ile)-lysidine synthase
VLSRVLKTISRYNMLPGGIRVIAAVSGGADSVCLLHVLKEIAPACLAGVAHFNHRWRPEASDEDELFVAALANEFSLPFFRAEGIAPGNREQEARRARLKFFRSLDATIALGHTRDDQAETVLFRFLRGSGLTGLSGIAPSADRIIRPLIDVTRAEIEQYLRARNIEWREDASNQDPAYSRNRIRHQLLPQLKKDWNPQLTETLARLADLAQEEETRWTQEIDGMLGPQPGQTSIELKASTLAILPRATARRLLRRAIEVAKGDLRQIDFSHIEAIFDLQRRLNLPGVIVTKSFDWLQIAPAIATQTYPSLPIAAPGTWPSPDGLTRICVDPAQVDPCATLKSEACRNCSPLELRGWHPGDHYRPAGKSRDQKIKEMFQKAHVPSWRRASWPIITCRDNVVWSRQFGIAEEFEGRLDIREVAV